MHEAIACLKVSQSVPPVHCTELDDKERICIFLFPGRGVGCSQQASRIGRHSPADQDPSLHSAVHAVLLAEGVLHGRLPGHGGAAELLQRGQRRWKAEADGGEAADVGPGVAEAGDGAVDAGRDIHPAGTVVKEGLSRRPADVHHDTP